MALNPKKLASKDDADEMPLLLHEIFFSRTDSRGVIQNGNAIFERVSRIPLSELIGAPHKIVRHPDMPKAVFWLFWESLKAGNPVGAYVKNRAADGRHYWVFAMATPLDDGYMSVRIKPTSPFFKKVVTLYEEVLAAEQSDGIVPEQSARTLIEKLGQMGFDDYPTFMAYAIGQESNARDAGLGRALNVNIASYFKMRDSLATVVQNGQGIVKGFRRIQSAPMNLRIKAAKMGDSAAALTAVMSNFDSLTKNVHSGIDDFLVGSNDVLTTVNDGLYVNCANNIQREAISRFKPTDDPERVDAIMSEAGRLNDLNMQYSGKIKTALQNIRAKITSFLETTADLKRTLSGLSVTRILCQIESARLDDPSGGIAEVINQLQQFQQLTYHALLKIEDECNKLKIQVESIMDYIKKRPDEFVPVEYPRPEITIDRRTTQRQEAE